jgi:hypothetical protein
VGEHHDLRTFARDGDVVIFVHVFRGLAG